MYKSNEKLTVRSVEISDVDILCSWWSDGVVMAHAGFPDGIETDRERLITRITDQNSGIQVKNHLLIIELDDDKRIGEMNYREKSEGIYEIGIKICDFGEHNKGYGSVAVNMLIDYLKEDLKAGLIVLDTNLNNDGAQRFYKELGFVQTRVMHDCWIDQLGRSQSAVLFEMVL